MSWSFAKLIDHWKTKHAHAAFVPAQQRLVPERQYRYGGSILLGKGAEFGLFLTALEAGKVYYDPGIKVEKGLHRKAGHEAAQPIHGQQQGYSRAVRFEPRR